MTTSVCELFHTQHTSVHRNLSLKISVATGYAIITLIWLHAYQRPAQHGLIAHCKLLKKILQKEKMSKTPKAPNGDQTKQVANKLAQSFHKNPTAKLLAGVGSGFLSGLVTRKVGRVPIALLGTSIIVFQAAQTHGLIKHSWDDVKEKANATKADQQGMVSNVKQFATENPAFTAGFAGGFLIGLTL